MMYACPACHGTLDAQAQLERDPTRGAWVICECLAVLRFDDGAGVGELMLRVASREELDGPEAPSELAACLKALKRANRRDARA